MRELILNPVVGLLLVVAAAQLAVAFRYSAVRAAVLWVVLFLGFTGGAVERWNAGIGAASDAVVILGWLLILAMAVLRLRRWTPIDVVAVLLAVTPLVWVIFSGRNLEFGLAGARLTGFGFAAFLIGRSTLFESSLLLRIVGTAMLPSMILGLRQAAFGLNASEAASVSAQQATYEVLGSVRLIGGATTGQEFAAQLLLALALAGAWACAKPSVRSVAVVLAVAILQFLALQRSALVGSLVMIALIAVELGRSRPRWLYATAAAVLAAVVLLLLPSSGAETRVGVAQERFSSLGDVASDPAFQERWTEVWPEAIDAIASRPVSGWGPGAAGSPSFLFASDAPLGPFFADNMALHIAVQYGLVYTCVALGFLLWLLRPLRRSVPSARELAGPLAIAGLLAAGLSGSYISLLDAVLPSLLLAGAAWAPLRSRAAEPPSSSRIDVASPARVA